MRRDRGKCLSGDGSDERPPRFISGASEREATKTPHVRTHQEELKISFSLRSGKREQVFLCPHLGSKGWRPRGHQGLDLFGEWKAPQSAASRENQQKRGQQFLPMDRARRSHPAGCGQHRGRVAGWHCCGTPPACGRERCFSRSLQGQSTGWRCCSDVI